MDFKITIHLQRRTSDVEFRPKKMLGPLIFIFRGFLVIFFVLQKNIVTVKKIQKSLFHKKNFLLNVILKMLWSKKDTQGSYYWVQKNFNQKKIKIKGVAFIKKISLNHTSETQKSVFFNILFEKCFYMQSLPTANFVLVWPNFCTP